MVTTIIIALVLVIVSLLLTGAVRLREKRPKEREKLTPFECGFSPIKKARAPFSMRFFITTLIFLIFDMEVAIVLPMGLLAGTIDKIVWFFTSFFVVLILCGGLFHE